MSRTPSIEELVKLKPNAKGDTYMDKSHTKIEYKYKARLGRHGVVNEGEQALWDTEEEALEAAKRFKATCQQALREKKVEDAVHV